MNTRNGPPASTYTPETDSTIREQVARYKALGLLPYQVRLILAAADALRKSIANKRPVEIVARFDGGVMYTGEVYPHGREQTGV